MCLPLKSTACVIPRTEGREGTRSAGREEANCPLHRDLIFRASISQARADLSGGFCDPAVAPALGGMFLFASVPVLAELTQGVNQPEK